jgi:5-formyltetrahydrofolate cyclo-ligase
LFPPEELTELTRRAKAQIRKRMRSLRKALPESALAERSARIVARLRELPAFASARSLALFWPMTSEVDLRSLDAQARSLGKAVYYPRLDRRDEKIFAGFARTETVEELVITVSRFAEPPATAPLAVRGELELIVVPALAVSPTAHRLGYGSGFYDAALPDFRPEALTAVVAFEFQLLAELPLEAHDVACDVVVTDERTLLPDADRPREANT